MSSVVVRLAGEFFVNAQRVEGVSFDGTKPIGYNHHDGVVALVGTCANSGKTIKAIGHAPDQPTLDALARHATVDGSIKFPSFDRV